MVPVRPPRRRLLLLVLLAACGHDAGPSGPLGSIEVAPPGRTLEEGEDFPLQVTLRDPDGVVVTGIPLEWNSDDPTIATVDSVGMVHGVAPGGTVIRASAHGQNDAVTVTIVTPIIASVTLRPLGDTLPLGIPLQLSAEVRSLRGNVITRPITWSTTTPGRVEVQAGGQVVGLTRGAGTVTLTSGTFSDTLPVTLLESFAQLASSGTRSCGLAASDSTAWCWGRELTILPAPLAGGQHFVRLAAGSWDHYCALTPTGAAYCWGVGGYGQLGNGAFADEVAPVAVAGGHQFADLDGGKSATCAVTVAGEPYCWGYFGWSGDTLKSTPVAISSPVPLRSIVTTERGACGLDDAGSTYCWGRGAAVGVGDTAAVADTFTAVAGGHVFAQLAGGQTGVCGRTVQGAVYCWGWMIMSGSTAWVVRDVPTLEPGITATHITRGAAHACALTAAGQGFCWGDNNRGQLAQVGSSGYPDPVLVRGGHTFTTLWAGEDTTCGTATDGFTYCWGDNAYGEVGNGRGNGVSEYLPVRVVLR